MKTRWLNKFRPVLNKLIPKQGKFVTLSLRLPQTVAKAVAKRAKQQNRSLNAQIVHELRPQMVFVHDFTGAAAQTYNGPVTISDNA